VHRQHFKRDDTHLADPLARLKCICRACPANNSVSPTKARHYFVSRLRSSFFTGVAEHIVDIILSHVCANHRLPNNTTFAQLIFTKVVRTLFCIMFVQLIGQSTRKLGCGARLRCVDASLVDALARMRQRRSLEPCPSMLVTKEPALRIISIQLKYGPWRDALLSEWKACRRADVKDRSSRLFELLVGACTRMDGVDVHAWSLNLGHCISYVNSPLVALSRWGILKASKKERGSPQCWCKTDP